MLLRNLTGRHCSVSSVSTACNLTASPSYAATDKAERERQRENEIRAFRDFSINLSSSAAPSAVAGRGGGCGGGGGFHDDDADFPRGPPKRAEYKNGGVSLDALRDPTVSVLGHSIYEEARGAWGVNAIPAVLLSIGTQFSPYARFDVKRSFTC